MAAGGVLVGRGYVSIRPEFEGDWDRSVNARASSAGRSGAGAFAKAFSVGLKGVGALAGVAIGANLASAAAGAAALAPALATAGVAAGALKIGLSGVGDAFKAAFADQSADVKAAASATRAVENAQRGLANAQRALAQARVDAAERVREAQRGVADAERDLADAQRDARRVQADLNDARQEAARALQDMNTRLKESQLDEREAALRLTEAQKELAAARAKPGTTPDELAKLQLAYDRATLNLQEQRTETKRLAADTAKANKAGIEGSDQVAEAKRKIAEANRNVADKERAVAEAQANVDKARVDGQQQIEDAQRAVAEAAAAVADAQAAAAAQTSKLDEAMAKLAPNARSFVNAVRGLQPAWDGLRLPVQNRLFQGLDSTVVRLAASTFPILKQRLTETAGIWNAIAKSAAAGVQEMTRSGILDKVLSGANANLAVFKDTPKQILTAFGQLTVAAQPAFNQLLTQFAGAITRFTDGIASSFTSGGLQQAIDTAFGILSSFGTLIGNVLGVVSQIFKAASDAGGQIVGVLGTVFGEIERILAAPQMQAQLRNLFTSVAQIVSAIVPVIGGIVQAVVPLVAAIAKPLAGLAVALGPVLQQLVTALGASLMPIVQALAPVLVTVGTAIVQIVQAVIPLLQPIADLIAGIVTALAPALTPVVNVITGLVGVLVGPLTRIIQAITPALVTVGQIIASVFQALEPFLQPLVALIGQVASLVADLFTTALQSLMRALRPLIPVGMQLINTVLGALTPILPILSDAFQTIGDALLRLLGPLSTVWSSLARQLAPILMNLAPLVGDLAGLFASTLAQVLPPLADALLALVDAVAPMLPVFGQVQGVLLKMAAGVLMQLLPSVLKLVQASVRLTLAVLPLLPPLAQLIGLVLDLALGVLSVLLPPLIRLTGFLVGGLAGALATVIGWVSSLFGWIAGKLGPIVKWLGGVFTTIIGGIVKVFRWFYDVLIGHSILPDIVNYLRNIFGPAFTWLRDNVIRPVWNAIKAVITTTWEKGIKPVLDTLRSAVGKVADAFSTARDNIGKQWSKLEGIAKKPVSFVIDTVYNAGIVGVWNKIASAFGAPKLAEFHPKGFASGGVLPGYTPGRDVHQFVSPTGGALELSGGEAIMRPEWTRAVGSGFVGTMNQLAKSRGAQGVKAALAPLLGGNPHTPTDRSLRYASGGVVQRYADGGIFGWIGKAGSALEGAGSEAWNDIKKGASWLGDTLESSARAGIRHAVEPLLKNFPGMDTGFGKMLRRIPDRIVNTLVGYSKKADDKGGGGLGGPKIQAALRWAKTQNGLPYQWGGNGNPSWDCSGFMSAIESVLRGEKPHRRWATMAFSGKTAPPGWVYHGNSPFRIGITNAGVGHTAGTLGGTNVESRGGDGVVVGSRARSYKDPLFTSWYGFKPGSYDSGGYLQPGFTLAFNGTGHPEPVLTGSQWNALAPGSQKTPVVVELHAKEGALGDFIDVRIQDHDQALVHVIQSS